MAMTTNFTLNNDGAPAYKKPDALAFRPHSQASINRGIIHAILQKDIAIEHSLDDLTIASGLARKAVYSASRALVLKGLAGRKDRIDIVTDGTKSVQKWVILIHGHDLFGKLQHSGW